MMRTIMSYPWNNPEHAMAREAFKNHLRNKLLADYCKPYGIQVCEPRETRLNEYLAAYSKPPPSFSYIDDDDAYTTYWNSVAKDNLR